MRIVLAGLLLAAALAVPSAVPAQDVEAPVRVDSPKGAAQSARQPPRREIVQEYAPDPAIWLLRDHDTTIYLLGTIHVLPEGFRWRSPRLDGIVADADELIVESTEGAEDGAEAAFIARLFESIESRPRVSKRLSPGNAAKWLKLGELVGVPPDYFDRMPPLLALFGIATGLNQEETGAQTRYGVETVLEADFRADGRPIGAIESATAVLSSLLAVDESLLIAELDRDLSRWDGKSLVTLTALGSSKASGAATAPLADEHAWAQGREVDVGPDLFGKTKFGRIVTRILLEDRNRAWAGWLENRLDEPGTVLVAVGAAHLAGDSSVQAMLSERGLETARLD